MRADCCYQQTTESPRHSLWTFLPPYPRPAPVPFWWFHCRLPHGSHLKNSVNAELVLNCLLIGLTLAAVLAQIYSHQGYTLIHDHPLLEFKLCLHLDLKKTCMWRLISLAVVGIFSPLQLFVGLSFPYEGPAPLEAIANGCAFLNPKFNPPKSSKNTDFFKGKPTLREVRGGERFLLSIWLLKGVFFLTSTLSWLSAADFSTSIRWGVHWSAPCVDGGHRKLCRGGEGHPLHPQPEGERGKRHKRNVCVDIINDAVRRHGNIYEMTVS